MSLLIAIIFFIAGTIVLPFSSADSYYGLFCFLISGLFTIAYKIGEIGGRKHD